MGGSEGELDLDTETPKIEFDFVWLDPRPPVLLLLLNTLPLLSGAAAPSGTGGSANRHYVQKIRTSGGTTANRQ